MKNFVLSYKRSGESASSRLMKEQVGGKKRVTASRKIILAVVEHLAKNQQQPNCTHRKIPSFLPVWGHVLARIVEEQEDSMLSDSFQHVNFHCSLIMGLC